MNCAAGFLLSNDSSGEVGKLSLGTGIIKIIGNTIVRATGVSEPSNLYIQAESEKINPIQIRGKIASGTEIRLDTGLTPTEGLSIQFTEGYGFTEGGNNAGVVPGNYFIGDKYGVTKAYATGEAVLAISSAGFGPLMNEPVTNDLANSTDNVFTPGTEKTITIKAFLTPEGDEKTEITSVVTSWKINLFENGDPQEGTFWSANRNVVTFELNGDVTLDFLFAGIGDSGYDISGIIDGKGHTAGETGGIVGENYGTITNCVKLRRRVKLIPNFEFKIPNT